MRQSYDFLCLLILYKTMPVCHRWTIAGGVHQNYYTQCILLEKEMTIKIFRDQGQVSVYTKNYAIVFLTGALMIRNVSIRGTYKTVCLIPYTLHFLYITERTGTKWFAHRFSFISLMAFSQSMHIKSCKSCTENIIQSAKCLGSTLWSAMIRMLIYTRLVHAMDSVLVHT